MVDIYKIKRAPIGANIKKKFVNLILFRRNISWRSICDLRDDCDAIGDVNSDCNDNAVASVDNLLHQSGSRTMFPSGTDECCWSCTMLNMTKGM